MQRRLVEDLEADVGFAQRSRDPVALGERTQYW